MSDINDTNSPENVPKKGQQKKIVNLGIAGRTAQTFIHSPITPMLLIACIVIGLLGLVLTPRQEDPQISVPMVDVFFKYPGATSQEVASLATDPLERIMSEIPGVKHVYSASERGQGMVTVEFDVGQKMEASLVKLYDKLASNLDKIPPGVSEPLTKPKSVDDVPIVTLTLWSKDVDDSALRMLALDLLQRLKEVPNTSQGFIVGGRSEQIRVEILPERLAGYGISLAQIAKTIQSANSKQDVGSSEIGSRVFSVYSGAFLRTADDISRLVVGIVNDQPVYVRDVARVSQGPSETTRLVNYYTGPAAAKGVLSAEGESAVTVAVAKKIGTNGVTVANAIMAKVEDLKGKLIPDNVQVAVTRNYGETADDKVNELLFKLIIATGAVTILVWFALGLRAALVVLIVIPVVILLTVFSAMILGYTIDRVSLFALIFSIGILVDDAIVVVENIYRRWLINGKMDTATAVDAVREVGNPTILATFTVIAALLPMGAVRGMMGPYMAPIPGLGSVAMVFSLFAAFIFAPWLAMRFKPSMSYLEKGQVREHAASERLGKLYRRLILPLINSKTRGYTFLVSLFVVFFMCCALFYTTSVTVKMMPFDNKPEFNVVINMPEGTALPVTANVTNRLVEKLRQVPEVTAIQSYVGTASPFNFNGMVRHYYMRSKPWEADIQVQLLHKNDRERSSHEIAQIVRDLLTPMAKDMRARIQVVEMPPGPPVLQSVVAEVYGPNDATRRQVATDLTQKFEESQTIVDVDNYLQEPYQLWRFEVDTRKAILRGVTVDTINSNLAMAMGSHVVGDVKQRSVIEPIYIVMQIPLEARAQMTRLKNLPIPTTNGTTVPLGELGEFVSLYEDPVIFHKDLRPVEYVTGDTAGRKGAPIYGMFEVEDILINYQSPDRVNLKGYYLGPPLDDNASSFEWGGEWTVTYETFRDMGLAFGVALVLIYMLVVWEFGNFTLPSIVMAPIPLTLIGIIPGHWIIGAEFTATSMIGFIALAGIIVRNSILLVDFSKHAVEAGTPVMDAVIQACKVRTRPILITAFALVSGSFVILFDPIFQGMAVSLMFGVLVSTFLTLLIIPLGCMSAGKAFCIREPQGEASLIPLSGQVAIKEDVESEPKVSFVSRAIGVTTMAMYATRAILYFAWMGIKAAAQTLMLKLRERKMSNATAGLDTGTGFTVESPPIDTPTQAKPQSERVQTTSTPQHARSTTTSSEIQNSSYNDHDDVRMNKSAASQTKQENPNTEHTSDKTAETSINGGTKKQKNEKLKTEQATLPTTQHVANPTELEIETHDSKHNQTTSIDLESAANEVMESNMGSKAGKTNQKIDDTKATTTSTLTTTSIENKKKIPKGQDAITTNEPESGKKEQKRAEKVAKKKSGTKGAIDEAAVNKIENPPSEINTDGASSDKSKTGSVKTKGAKKKASTANKSVTKTEKKTSLKQESKAKNAGSSRNSTGSKKKAIQTKEPDEDSSKQSKTAGDRKRRGIRLKQDLD